MFIKIDFNSDEAIYVQLQNQIIMGIAMDILREGDNLPSVRQMAETVGINMHTVNKAYTILKQDGFIQLGRRGAVICVDVDKATLLCTAQDGFRQHITQSLRKQGQNINSHRISFLRSA